MLAPAVVAEIKAAEGLYRACDVARNYGVHRSTVKRIWAGTIHSGVPVGQVPNVVTRPRPSELYEDIHILLGRGMSTDEVAQALGISTASVRAARGLFV